MLQGTEHGIIHVKIGIAVSHKLAYNISRDLASSSRTIAGTWRVHVTELLRSFRHGHFVGRYIQDLLQGSSTYVGEATVRTVRHLLSLRAHLV